MKPIERAPIDADGKYRLKSARRFKAQRELEKKQPGFLPPPQRRKMEAERAEQVRRAVDKLSETCRQVVEALFYRDPPLSYKELATEMGRPHGSLGPTRLRCLESLRQRLLDEDEW